MTLRTGEWSGERVWVVGAGASLRGFDFGLIAGDRSIGCNHAMRWTTAGMANDGRWVREFGAMPGAVHRCWLATEDSWTAPEPWQVLRKARPERWTDRLEDGLIHGPLTGLTAIHLADILGAREILLLGFDMRPEGPTHYHADYAGRDGWETTPAAYAGHLEHFRRWAGCIRAEVYNLTPGSALDAFPMRSALWGRKGLRGLVRRA